MSTTYIKQFGTIYPNEFTNKCCEDKPILLMAIFDDDIPHGYSCECECGLWNTNAYRNLVQPIMEYEHMCRMYPRPIRFRDPQLIKKYMRYYGKVDLPSTDKPWPKWQPDQCKEDPD